MNIGKWFAMLAVMLAMTGFVLAETDDTNATISQALQVRYDHLACKVVFTNTQIDLLAQYVPEVNLIGSKDLLNNDMSILQGFMDSNEKDSFDNFTAKDFRRDLQNATQTLNDVKKNFRQYNVSNESRTALVAGIKTARDAYSGCISDKELKMSRLLERQMGNLDRQWGKIIENMAKHGLNTTEMESLRAQFESQSAEFQTMVAAGNTTQLAKYMEDYRQEHLHYAARFEVARLKGYAQKLGPMADELNLSGKISGIDKKITDANKYTQPGYKYMDDSFKNTWKNIIGAGKDMKDLSKDILKERAQNRTRPANMPDTGNGSRIGQIAERRGGK